MTVGSTGRYRNSSNAMKTINNGWTTAETCHPIKQMTSMTYNNTYTMP
jgi:hypothetical protein